MQVVNLVLQVSRLGVGGCPASAERGSVKRRSAALPSSPADRLSHGVDHHEEGRLYEDLEDAHRHSSHLVMHQDDHYPPAIRGMFFSHLVWLDGTMDSTGQVLSSGQEREVRAAVPCNAYIHVRELWS